MRTRARYPDIPAGTGHYESFYLKATAPGGGRAVWIRHTVHRRPGAAETASVWFVLFGDGPPRAAKVTVGAETLCVPADGYLRVGTSTIGPDGMAGDIAAADVSARWSLSFADRAEALRHLPVSWMYTAGFPRTKVESPHPALAVDGELTVGDELIALSGWDGILGHNWGTEHAERWVWLQAPLDGGYLDIAAARVRVGSRSLPWIANGGLLLDGQRTALGGLARLGATRVTAETGRCSFVAGAPGLKVRGTLSAPATDLVGWVYADPDGGGHHVTNSSVADLELTVQRRGQPDRRVEVHRAAALELGTREPQPRVPQQPFPDG